MGERKSQRDSASEPISDQHRVLGYSELLADGLYGDIPQKALDVLERIQANGKHLLSLINDVLDISKIEAGQLTLALDDYSVETMVQSVVAATGSLAQAKGLEVKTSVPNDLPMGRGDERRLTQVLLNLVSNAIKFTDTGGVEVRVQAVGKVADDVLFVVYTDRGDTRHLISARLANRKERRLWQSFAAQWKTSVE